jgi:hypothetical protein
MKEQDAEGLAGVLPQCPALAHLDLSGNSGVQADRISTLALPECDMKEQDAEGLAGVLPQCPALAHLDLSGNSGFRALCHLFNGQATRKSEMLYTYSVVAFGLALSL